MITSGDGLTALADGEDKTVSDPPPRCLAFTLIFEGDKAFYYDIFDYDYNPICPSYYYYLSYLLID